jgi:intraflagellar transport protein 122
MLGIEALLAQQFYLAKKCFTRIKDLPYIELAYKYEGKKLDPAQEAFLVAETLSYQQKFQDAGNYLMKAGLADKAVELFSEMKKWDDAKCTHFT